MSCISFVFVIKHIRMWVVSELNCRFVIRRHALCLCQHMEGAYTGGVDQHLYLNNGPSSTAVMSTWWPPALPPLMISLENEYQDSGARSR